MKIIFDHIKLRQSLKRIAAAVNNKSILPALENVHLAVTKTSCTLTTTDQIAYMQTTCDCDADGTFTVLLRFAELQKIAAVIAGPLTIEVDQKKFRAKLTSGADVFEMGIEKDAKIFPDMPTIEPVATFAVPEDLLNLLVKAALITKNDTVDNRFEHLCFDCKPGEPVVIYATDLWRAVRIKTEIVTDAEVRLPLHKNHIKPLREIGGCVFSFDDRWIKTEGLHVTALFLRGESQWPDGGIMFQGHDGFNVEASRTDLDSALQKVQVYNVEFPKMLLQFGLNGHVAVSFNEEAYGYSFNSVMQAKQELDPVDYMLNAKLLPELMNCLPEQELIDMQVLANGKMMYIGNKEHPSITCVIMPIVQPSKN